MKPQSIISGLISSIHGFMYFFGLIMFVFFIGLAENICATNVNNEATNDSVFQVVDKRPIFKGKPSDIHKFIKSNLVYPDAAWMNGVEGVVQVSFVVTKEGSVINAKIEKSASAELNIEALRLVDLLENWKPAMKNGVAVHAYVSMPIEFTLKPNEKEFVGMLKKYGLNENPPLYIIDGKIVNSRIHLPSYNLESLKVLKGEKAIDNYGVSAKNGVVIITTKRGTPPVW